jgi:hypothetical protein
LIKRRDTDMGRWKAEGEERLTGHEVREMAVGLSEDHVSVLGDTLLELLLEVSATVLILAERKDLALEVFDSGAGESVD